MWGKGLGSFLFVFVYGHPVIPPSFVERSTVFTYREYKFPYPIGFSMFSDREVLGLESQRLQLQLERIESMCAFKNTFLMKLTFVTRISAIPSVYSLSISNPGVGICSAAPHMGYYKEN